MFRCLILLFFPLQLFAFTDGVILIHYPNGEDRPIKIYKSATDHLPFTVCNTQEQLDSLLPSYYVVYTGAPSICYCYSAETNDRYCIRIDSSSAPFYWIEKDSLTEFSTWKSWWTGWGEVFIGQGEPIHKLPNENSALVKKTCDCYIAMVDSISGEWMKVVFSEYCGNDKVDCPLEKVSYPLWVRWRKGDVIYFEPYIAE